MPQAVECSTPSKYQNLSELFLAYHVSLFRSWVAMNEAFGLLWLNGSHSWMSRHEL